MRGVTNTEMETGKSVTEQEVRLFIFIFIYIWPCDWEAGMYAIENGKVIV